MNRLYAFATGGVLLLAILSCGLADRLTGSDKLTRTERLWSDVPPLDGMRPSELELPFAVKVFMRTVLNNLWRFNKDGEDKTPSSGDWAAYQSDGTASDVEDFYTNDRMSSFGNWDPSEKSTCIDGKDKGVDGVICVFKKTVDPNDVGLAVIAMPDEKKKITNIFFIRVESPRGAKK